MRWFCGVLFLVNCYFVSADVSPATRNALEELYNSTNGPNWYNNYGWMSDSDPCQWVGVSCASKGGAITLYLGLNNLNGTLPSSIFTDVENFEELYVPDNNLGTLPDSIGYTNIWSYIALDYSQVTGTLPDTFVAQPDTNGGSYPFLTMRSNQLNGTIPPSFSVVNDYGGFDISNNYFFCPFPEYCADHVSDNCGECYQRIEQVEIDSLTSLYKDTNGPQWKQSTNWLTGSPCPDDPNLQWFGVECFLDKKNHQQQVGSLNLRNNGLQGQVILDSLSGLTQLDLSQNDFDPSPLPDLSDSPQLVSLDLSQNNFTGTIPSSIANLFFLDTLNLSSNSLGGVLPRSVCGIYYLNLTGNDWVCPLPPCCNQATPPGNEPCGSCS